MFSDLPVGTLFVVTERNQQVLYKIVAFKGYPPEHRYYQPLEKTGDKAYTGVDRPIEVGETIHRCVWKGNKLESRRAYVVKQGDVEWCSTEMMSRVPPYEIVWHNVLKRKI